MKKMTKLLISVILVICVAVSALAFTGIFSSAQAIPKDVSIDFTAADNDWVTLSGTTIQDKALKVTIYNFSDDTIVLSKIENNGTAIRYDGWTQNTRLEASGVTNIGISGTTTNNAVLCVTVTYYVEGNPAATAETCSAYIYASSGQAYISGQDNATIDSGPGVFGLNTTTTMSPLSTASTTYETVKRNVALFVYATCHDPTTTATVYIDGSKYKLWDEFNFHIDFWNDGDKRDHAFFDKIHMTQTSSTGSLFLVGYGTDPQHKDITSEFNNDKNNPDGFSLQAGKDATVPGPFTGTIPTEASSTFTINLRQYGQTGGVFGVASTKTKEVLSTWNITVYNNNKGALRERLNALSALGLNKGSYKSGWDAYETALKNAYTVLGTIKKTAGEVQSALNAVNTAYNNLVRYAVVYTNHYYYQGSDNTQPVQISKKIDMKVTNNASYTAEVLSAGSFPAYPFNRTNVIKQKTVSVGTATNFTDTINQYYWYVDTAALEAAIAKQAAKVNVDEDGNDIYSADSWQNYQNAANAATRILNDLTLFQTDIDAATKSVNDAEKALVKLDIDTAWLEEGIGWAANIIDDSYDDDFGRDWQTGRLFGSTYAQGLYANLVSAYNEAVEVTNDPDFTKAQADRVCAALWQAINELRVKDETTKGLYIVDSVYHADIDRYGYIQGLRDKLIEPNGLRVVYNDILDNTTGNYRLNEADFTEDSWHMLQDALYGDFAPDSWACASTEEPYPTYDGEDEMSVPAYSMIHNIWFLASQADYNACRDNLLDKVNNLEWVIDASSLEDKLTEAMEYDLNAYTKSTADVLNTAIEQAANTLEKLDEPQLYGDPEAVTNDTVDGLVDALNTAIAALRIRPSLTPAGEDIAFVEADQTAVYGENVGQTVGEALKDFTIVNHSDTVVMKVYDNEKRETALNDRLGTGYTLVLSDESGEIYETHTFVIKGDVIGDTQVSENDFALVYNYAFFEDTLEGYFLEAADMNDDGVVDLSDAIMVQEMFA